MRASLLAAAISVAFAPVARAQCSTANQKLIADQKFEEARVDVRGLLRSNPNDDAALHCMGTIAISEDKSGDAVEWFEKAIKVNERSSVHHLWLGNALGEQAGHTSKFKLPFLARRVKGEFDRAAELDPSSVDARHGLIQFYSQAPGAMGGSMDKAKEQAREIEKLNAWRGHYEMAQLLERDKEAAGAEREYTAAVGAAPDSNATYLYLGSFLRRQ